MILQLYKNEMFDQNQRKTNFPKALVKQGRQKPGWSLPMGETSGDVPMVCFRDFLAWKQLQGRAEETG